MSLAERMLLLWNIFSVLIDDSEQRVVVFDVRAVGVAEIVIHQDFKGTVFLCFQRCHIQLLVKNLHVTGTIIT